METQNKQQLAKDLYLQADKSKTDIAEILDVNRKTVYLWCKKGKWEETKTAIRQAPSSLLQTFYNHITEVNRKIEDREDKCPTMHEIDMLRKLMKMTKDLGKKNTGFYIEAFQELSFFIGTADKPFSDKFNTHVSEFVSGTFSDDFWPGSRAALENIAMIRENLEKQANKSPEELAQEELEAEALGEEDEDKIFDGYSFVPSSKYVPGSFPYTNDFAEEIGDWERQTDNTPTEKLAPAEPPVGKNGAFAQSGVNPPEPAIIDTYGGNVAENKCPISQTEKSENTGASVGADTCVRPVSRPCVLPVEENSAPNSTAPTPATRPAPFREGNIIWINHPKDLDDYEKHLKMSDSVRYYPESDPSLIYNRVK